MSGKCEKCGAKAVIKVSAKCSDRCSIVYDNLEHYDYVPHDIGIGGGDYIKFEYCHACMSIQDAPVSSETVRSALDPTYEERD